MAGQEEAQHRLNMGPTSIGCISWWLWCTLWSKID